MKRINSIFMVLMVALMGLSLTACDQGDDLNTDQYGKGIALNAFGPCPVLRGGTLFFYGSNLDQISEIQLPGADPITSYEVLEAGDHSRISIKVPAEKCDTGIVILKTNKGGEIRSVSPIVYREDVKIDKFYVGSDESNTAGAVGDILTIKGDYLNLMHGIIFEGNDTIKEDQFLSHTRYQISCAIPPTAKNGTFKLTDMASEATEMETEVALTVALPEVSEITPQKIKAGQTLTIKGKSLDQIVSVKLNGNVTLEADAFKVSEDGKTLSFVLPVAATDGTVTLVTMSGVDIVAETAIETVVPTELKAEPSPVKNGADLTITGKDLDLVLTASFKNANDAVNPKSIAENKIVVTVPETAQEEGGVTLNLANGKSVNVAFTLVQPTVTACSPAALTAGDKVIIKGTDLDLVAAIVLPGDEPLTVSSDQFSAHTASAIALTVPAAAAGEGMTLNLKNGKSVKAEGLSIKAATSPAISSCPQGATAGAEVTIKGKNFQNVQNLYIGSYKVTKYVSRSAEEIVFNVPANAAEGAYKLVMEDFDGNRIEGADFSVLPKEYDLAGYLTLMDNNKISYPFNFTWGDDGRFRVYKADLKAMGVKLGSKLLVYKQQGTTGQVQINDCNWGGIETIADWNATETVLVKVFDDAMMKAVNETADGWSDTALIIQGDLSGVTKIAILP